MPAVQVDVQPHLIRLLIKGRLLQLLLPCEVRTDASTAQRSNATGRLQITMPKENPQEVVVDVAHIRWVHLAVSVQGKQVQRAMLHTQSLLLLHLLPLEL